jgi:hypothetical protein
MKPFRTSITARIVSLSIAFALAGAGLIPIAGFSAAVALPIVFIAAVGGCIIGLVLGVNDHPGPVAVLAMMLPLALWPFTMVAIGVATRFGAYGWALIAAACVMSGATAIASFTTRREPRLATHDVASRAA